MKQKEIRVLVVAPGEHPRKVVLKNGLDALQKVVSTDSDYRGLIKVVWLEDSMCIVCDFNHCPLVFPWNGKMLFFG